MNNWKTFMDGLSGETQSVLLVQYKNTNSWEARIIGVKDTTFIMGNVDYKDVFSLADNLIKRGVPTLLMKV